MVRKTFAYAYRWCTQRRRVYPYWKLKMEKSFFKCYRLFLDTWKKITDPELKAKYYEWLLEYGLNGTKPDDPIIDALLTSAMYSIDKTDEDRARKSEAMMGNSNAVKNWENVLKQTKTETNSSEQTTTDKNIWRRMKKNEEEWNREKKNEENKKEIKKRYMEFVLLTDDEYGKLLCQFGAKATKEKIEDLNNYIWSTGRKYKSHYHTILSWDRKNWWGTTDVQKEQALARHREMIAEQIKDFNSTNTTNENTNIQTTNRREEMYG